MSKRVLLILGIFFCFMQSDAQSEYVFKLSFSDKNGTSHTLSNPSTYLSPRAIQHRSRYQIAIDSLDLPVSGVYLDDVLTLTTSTLHGSSRWLNAGYFVTDDSSTFVAAVDTLTYVTSIERVAFYPGGYGDAGFQTGGEDQMPDLSRVSYNYGNGNGPMLLHNATTLHQRDFIGSGSLVAVLDDGFESVNTNPCFSQLYNTGKIKATKNFVRPTMDVYSTGYHGTRMMSILGALEEGRLVGTAPGADYILIVSEDKRSEKRIEVENMVLAMEFADSMGVDVISSSIGYNTFDNPADNYTIADLDGRTCSASIAATIAARKGIIVVTSAGNENGTLWNRILFPSDADSILTVGSVKSDGSWGLFSAKGPTADGRIKPDVGSLSAGVYTISRGDALLVESGTSMAVPIIAGLTACLIGMDTTRAPQSYISLIREYSSLYNAPTADRGYGVPNFGSLAYLLDVPLVELSADLVELYPNPTSDGRTKILKKSELKLNSVLTLDISGRVISEQKLDSSADLQWIETPELPGVYSVILKTETGIITKPLTVL